MRTLVPTSKVTLTLMLPVLVLLLCIYSICGVPFTCSSMGVATVCSTVSASAPVYDADTETLGGDISGYWSTARLSRHISPAITNTSDITIAVTGLLINVFAIMPHPGYYAARAIFVSQIPIQGRYFAPQLFWLFL